MHLAQDRARFLIHDHLVVRVVAPVNRTMDVLPSLRVAVKLGSVRPLKPRLARTVFARLQSRSLAAMTVLAETNLARVAAAVRTWAIGRRIAAIVESSAAVLAQDRHVAVRHRRSE